VQTCALPISNRILGKFIVRDGHGIIEAGTELGSGSSPVSLSLISGGWTAHAHDIYLNEVLNPNGAFNNNLVGIVGDKVRFRFDYAADAYVNLRADNSVQLLGSNPGHVSDNA